MYISTWVQSTYMLKLKQNRFLLVSHIIYISIGLCHALMTLGETIFTFQLDKGELELTDPTQKKKWRNISCGQTHIFRLFYGFLLLCCVVPCSCCAIYIPAVVLSLFLSLHRPLCNVQRYHFWLLWKETETKWSTNAMYFSLVVADSVNFCTVWRIW